LAKLRQIISEEQKLCHRIRESFKLLDDSLTGFIAHNYDELWIFGPISMAGTMIIQTHLLGNKCNIYDKN
jgi:hypothetical protein